MARPARKAKPKSRQPARKPSRQAKRRTSSLVGLVWVTAGALGVAVLALAAILMFGPGARDTPAPRVATTQMPAASVPAQPAVQPPAQPPEPTAPPPQTAAVPSPVPLPVETWLQNAMPVSVAAGQPMIAVVIDDMGLDRRRSELTIALPISPTRIILMPRRGPPAQPAMNCSSTCRWSPDPVPIPAPTLS
jgi:hypothetical protein